MKNPEKMLDSEKEELFIKITKFVGERLRAMIKLTKGRWKQREIREHFGISESKQTIYANYNKYGKRITKKDLVKCIDGGIITTQELIDCCSSNLKELNFLEKL